MHPILFHIGAFVVRSAGALYLLAIAVASISAVRIARHRGWNTDDVLPGVALVVLAAYVGARVYGAVADWDRFKASPLGSFEQPSLGFFGGLALGGLALVGYRKWRELPIGAVADALSPIAPVVYAIFRAGCLLNGDDYGVPTSLPWGVRFPHGSPPMPEPVHPTQVYEIVMMVPIFLWIWPRRNRPEAPGATAFELCVLMGVERFLIDFLRVWSHTGLVSPTQLLALSLVAAGLIGRLQVTKRARVA